MRWILNILHDPKYVEPWELSCHSILRSCGMLFRVQGLGQAGGQAELPLYWTIKDVGSYSIFPRIMRLLLFRRVVSWDFSKTPILEVAQNKGYKL